MYGGIFAFQNRLGLLEGNMKKVKGSFSIDHGDGCENVSFLNERGAFFFFKLCPVYSFVK